jgi:hypothetical protein
LLGGNQYISQKERMTMTKIKAESHVCNDMKRTSLERSSPSWRTTVVLVGSLASGVLASVPIEVAHADQPTSVDCRVDTPNGLIAAINSATPGAVLSLAQGCVYVLTSPVSNPPDRTLGDSGLLITKMLTIKGNGATITRTSAQHFRIFLVAQNGGDLTISDLTIDNGDTSGTDVKAGRGGGIFNLAALKVTNSTLSRNHASVGGGGIGNGIPADAGVPIPGNLTLSDSVFFDNDAGLGGAIASGTGSTMNLSGCTISHNIASIEGGGVANAGTAILNKCTISGNTTTGIGGGGIDNGGQMFLTDSLVSGNNASGNTTDPTNTGLGGGLLNVASAIVTLSHTHVTGNSATNGGGGIVNASFQGQVGTATVIDSDVSGNSTTAINPGAGPAFLGGGAGILNGGNMSLTHSNVTGNNATADGGGIYNASDPNSGAALANLTLTHSDVTNNNAGQGHHGGGIFNQNGNTVQANQTTVVFNTPDDCSGVLVCPSISRAVSQ